MLEPNEIVTGYNSVWIVASASVAFSFSFLICRRLRLGIRDYTTDLLVGVALVSYGSIIHRVFWTIWGLLHESGEAQMAEHLIAFALPVGILSSLMVSFGYAYHFAPIARRPFGRWWKPAIVATLMVTFWLGALLDRYAF